MEAITFALFAKPGRAEQETLLFTKSLRQFGGIYKNAPVWVMTLESHPLSKDTVTQLEKYRVQLQTVELAEDLINFPFAAKSMIAGLAETLIKGTSQLMVWLDRDSLIIHEPNELILPAGKTLGYRPVDHKNIGSPYDEPPDGFWETLYQHSHVSPDKVFPILTSVDQIHLRPYINAGMLVVRPEAGLLHQWGSAFKKIYQHPEITPYYEKHPLYKIFIHQAVLSAMLTRVLPFEEWFELPYQINYPLHMHKNYPTHKKPKDIHQVVTCRYDTFFEDKNWQEQISLPDPFGSWLLHNISPLLDSIAKEIH